MEKELNVIVWRSTAADWISSLANIATVVGISVANHRWGGGSAWLDAFAVVLAFVTLLAMTFRKSATSWRGTVDDAIEHLKSIRDNRT